MSVGQKMRRRVIGTFFLAALSISAFFSGARANASATLLLEEPYGKLGFFTATGHAAVYLSGVCAETPLLLRPCAPGELGAVISRYNGVGGRDWIAIPLIPYLYAVDTPRDIPLFVNAKMVSFLRDQYRRKHLEMVAPDLDGGKTPGGNWYELVGSAYDRASYAFEIETSPGRDLALIHSLNTGPNDAHFRTVSHNCADFAKDVINFYYPKALHRSVVADVGMTTPKQMAKTMVKFSTRHPEFQFSRYVIPQVPGVEARSSAVHGVVESFFKSKKYFVPSLVASPIFAGCVVAVYVGTGTGHFDPSQHALVYNASRGLEPRVNDEDRRSYQIELNRLLAADLANAGTSRIEKALHRAMNDGAPGFDSQGRPVLRIDAGTEPETLGVTEANLSPIASSGRFGQQLLEARLHEELRKGSPPKISESDLEHDWKLLQTALNNSSDQASNSTKILAGGTLTRWAPAGNQP